MDDLDAKLHQATRILADVEQGWSEYDGFFAREFFRHGRRPASRKLDGGPGRRRSRDMDALDLFPD